MKIQLNIAKVLGFTVHIPRAPMATQMVLGTMGLALVGAVAYWLLG